MVEIIEVVNLVALRRAIGRSETTKSRRIHLLLQQVTIIGIMNVRVGGHALRIRSKLIRGGLSCLGSHSSEQLSFIINFRCSLASSATLWAHLGLPLVRLVAILSEYYLRELVRLLAVQATASKLGFQSAIHWSSLTWTILAILDNLLIIFPGYSSASSGLFTRNATSAFRIIGLDLLNTPITRVPVSLITVGSDWTAAVCTAFASFGWASVE